ncbi:MAG: hypothetical protein AB7F79_05730 [Steroidobacteraceae bacterium]
MNAINPLSSSLALHDTATLVSCNPWQQLTSAACIALLLMLSACQKAVPTAAAPTTEAATETPEVETTASVTLEPDAIAHMGIVTHTAKAIMYAAEKEGYGIVLGHDAIAQSVAEVATAEAAVQQSHAALARVQRLADTPGAFAAEINENATRQAAADAAALTLAQRRLSATLGQNPPWKGSESSTVLGKLASGQIKLVRVTFPLGVLNGAAPHSLRIAHLDPNSVTDSWKTNSVWDAPADASIPGRSFFALLRDTDVGEGEHLQVWVGSGAAESGTELPASAVVISDGRYWCYVEKPAGTFVRTAVDTSNPMTNSYFVKDGIAAGDNIVITGAGLLLARQTNSSTEAE